MKKTASFMAMLLLILGLLVACNNESGSPTTTDEDGSSTVEFNIGTAGTGGALYPMGVAMAQTLNENSNTLKASAISTGGSIENIRQIVKGEQGIGIASADVAFFAYEGIDQYKGNQVKELRSLFSHITQWALVFTRADSEVSSIEDLKGKRVGVGAPGSGGENTARKILESHGITYDNIEEEFLADSEMSEGLKDKTLDAIFITNPLNSATLMDLSNSIDIKLLPVDNPKFYEDNPYFTMTDVPSGTYPGQDNPVPTPINRIMYVALNDGELSNENIKELLQTLWDHSEPWIESHKAVQNDTNFESAIDGVSIPLHAGAVEYYKEKGLDIPEALIPPEMK